MTKTHDEPLLGQCRSVTLSACMAADGPYKGRFLLAMDEVQNAPVGLMNVASVQQSTRMHLSLEEAKALRTAIDHYIIEKETP